MRAWLSVVFAAAACGAPTTGGSGDDAPPGDASSDTADSAVPPGWTTLIERNWQLQPKVEDYICKRIKVEQDTYIGGFRAKAPTGTHHKLLTISTDAGPVGDYECDASNSDTQLLFAGGIGTDDMEFPAGVAIKIPAGSYVKLQLHVFNLSDAPLSGTSGILVKTMAASEVVHEADMMFLGTFDIQIPPNSTNHLEAGSCSVPTTWTIFNFWPHMHGYARHQKVLVKRNGATSTQMLLDVPYNYEEQRNYPMGSVVINPNDELQVECYYDNNTSQQITYGDSATQEMCFAGFYKYPKGGGLYFCAQL